MSGGVEEGYRKVTAFSLSPATIKLINSLAANAGCSRSLLVEKLLIFALDELTKGKSGKSPISGKVEQGGEGGGGGGDK